jgi:hypothetical protein
LFIQHSAQRKRNGEELNTDTDRKNNETTQTQLKTQLTTFCIRVLVRAFHTYTAQKEWLDRESPDPWGSESIQKRIDVLQRERGEGQNIYQPDKHSFSV